VEGDGETGEVSLKHIAVDDCGKAIKAKALRKLRHSSRSRKLKAFLEGSRI
jgi:hypothetical protein